MNFDPSPLREEQDRFQEIDADPMPLRLFGAFGILCYTVSPKGVDLSAAGSVSRCATRSSPSPAWAAR